MNVAAGCNGHKSQDREAYEVNIKIVQTTGKGDLGYRDCSVYYPRAHRPHLVSCEWRALFCTPGHLGASTGQDPFVWHQPRTHAMHTCNLRDLMPLLSSLLRPRLIVLDVSLTSLRFEVLHTSFLWLKT